MPFRVLWQEWFKTMCTVRIFIAIWQWLRGMRFGQISYNATLPLFCFSVSSTLMETRHVCSSKSPHTCAGMIYPRNERRWPSCVCVFTNWLNNPPKARVLEGYPHIHAQLCLHQPITARDTIPTGANQGECTKQAHWPLTDLRALR